MKRTSCRQLQIFSILALAAIMVTGCNFLPVEEEELAPPLMQPAKIEFKTEPAARGTLIQHLILSGSFVPMIQRSLSFEEQGGRLKAKHVQLGHEVKAGDPIAELDSSNLTYQIAIQKIEIEKSKISLSQMRANDTGYYAIRRAQLDLKQQELRLQNLNKQLAAAQIAELDSSNLAYQIAIQKIEIEKSKISLSQISANDPGYYAIRRAQLDLKQQELRLQNLNKQLAATQIVAPFDGKITYIISTSIGEYINAYQIVAKVADMSELVLVTTHDKAFELPIGAEVTVEFQKEELVGEVVANPSSLFNDPDENLRRAAIVKIVGELPEKVSLGSNARIVYVKDIREDVIILPRRQINLISDRRYVNVLEDGLRVEKDVEIGLMTDTEAEIIKGLDEGDLVIVN